MSVAIGDILEIRLPEGFVYGRVLLLPAAYPPAIGFLPGVHPEPLETAETNLWREGYAIFLSPLKRAEAAGMVRVMNAGLPAARLPKPRFRVPVRDRMNRILYEWEWDGERIELRGEDDNEVLPVREIVPLERLVEIFRSKCLGSES